MEYQIAKTKVQALSNRAHYLLLISVGLLISNIFLVWLVFWSCTNQNRTIVPIEIKQPFTVSNNAVDASYLQQMALFFIAQRLNITPSNIDHSHTNILHHADPRFYHEFVSILGKEKQAVIKQNISSVFYPEEVMPNPQITTVVVKGSLMHWVGGLALVPVKKQYTIKFNYKSGRLKVLSFSEDTEQDQAERI